LDETIQVAFTSPAFGATEGKRAFFTRVGMIPLAGNSLDDLTRASDDMVRSLQNGLPSKGPWVARISSQVYESASWSNYNRLNQFDSYKWNGVVNRIGAGLDFVLGFGFQLHNDLGSPYFTSMQVGSRALVAGGGGAIFGGVGGLIGGLCGPAALICVPVGAVVGGVIWSEYVQPIFLEAIPFFRPAERNLMQMN
jgi:hypothetical protein